jgi:hypothetical protein
MLLFIGEQRSIFMTVSITTTVECTWPADDVSIIQKIKRDGYPDDIRWVGLRVDEIDRLILNLQAAKAQAEKWEAEYNVHCDAQRTVCPICGGSIEGDGVTVALHCENVDASDLCVEPDADPVYCQ